MLFRLNSGQTRAVKARLGLGGEAGMLPKSPLEHQGCTRAKQAGYTGGLPEIYRKFTGGKPEHHHRTTFPPRQPRWDAPTAEMWTAAASEARRRLGWARHGRMAQGIA